MSDQSAAGGTLTPDLLVTVIIRTKDRPELLDRALASVVAQTHRPLEVLVVNDGLYDVTQQCLRHTGDLLGLRVVPAAAPGGRVSAANTGLLQAGGDAVIFLDDDDWFYPDHVSKLASALLQHPGEALAYTGVECRRADPASGELQTEHVFNQDFEHAFLLIRNFIPMHAALFRRSLLDDATRFDAQLDYYEDWDFWLQLARKTSFRHVPGISACYFLDNSGFGLEQTQRQQAAERAFFAKWQQLWTPEELALVVEYARQLPGVRQAAHEQFVQFRTESERVVAELQGLLDAERKVLVEERMLLVEERARRARLAQLHQDTLAILQQTQREQMALQSEHLRMKDDLLFTAQSLADVLASRSWKLTEPLRRTVMAARRQRQRLRSWHQRARVAATVLRERGFRGLLVHVRQRQQLAPAPAPVAAGGITPFALRCIDPALLGSVAESLCFASAAIPRVSIVIPVYNHVALTLACLQSLHDNPPHCSYEIIVVDDASSDATPELLALCQGLQLLRNDSNSGFIRTCNKGAAAARGEYLCFLNNDTEVQPGWLDPLVATLDADARAGIAGAKLVYPSGHLQEAGACLRADGTVDLVGLNDDPADPRYNHARPVDHCSGAAILVRATLFRELGGFDERYVPAYFEDCDLSLKVQEAGYKVIYQPASVVVHHLSVTTGAMPGGKLAQIARNREIYLARWGKWLREQDRIRLIAFFLPQFHPIPENDAWWGKGFTEWTNVTRAQPLFDGHYQPHRPGELGYYDLRVAEVREQQARLAREYGIYGFCYYYYWFDGRRLLERPLNDLLERGEPDFPFCVCWANENWTRRWDGREAEVLMAQRYNPESNLQFMRDLLPLLRDPRYIRINGRPLVLIYRAELIPGLGDAIAGWRQLTRDAGLGELYLAAVESFSGVREDLACEFDALVEFPPHARSVAVTQPPPGLSGDFRGQLYDYEMSAQAFMQRRDVAPQLFRTAMPSWDNTPRRQQAAHIYLGATPHRYQNWLASLVRETRERRMGEERIVFVNAWNEWAEGNHLEPDERHGRDWLEATRNALGDLGCYVDLYPDDAGTAATPQATASGLPGLNLIGHLYAVLGRAEDIRTAALACVAADIPLCLINRHGDYDRDLREQHKDFPFFDRVSDTPQHAVNLFFLNADEMPSAWEHYGARWFGGRYNIGCFAWELSHYPEPWKASLQHLQELWAPTEFIRQALLPATTLPVVHMPFVIEPGPPGPHTRADFGLPVDRFLFLFFFDFRSFVSRKNPQAVLEAFFQAFPAGDDAPVHLVIKVNGQRDKSDEYAAFRRDPRMQDARISVIDTALDDKGIKSLVALCDAFVSLHRSEGFGRGLAEAMYYGKPVIGTAYSGNLDFMTPDNSCLVDYHLIDLQDGDYPFWQGQQWADADVAQAARYMQRLVTEPGYAEDIGGKARTHILEHHSSRAVGQRMRARLAELGLIETP